MWSEQKGAYRDSLLFQGHVPWPQMSLPAPSCPALAHRSTMPWTFADPSELSGSVLLEVCLTSLMNPEIQKIKHVLYEIGLPKKWRIHHVCSGMNRVPICGLPPQTTSNLLFEKLNTYHFPSIPIIFHTYRWLYHFTHWNLFPTKIGTPATNGSLQFHLPWPWGCRPCTTGKPAMMQSSPLTLLIGGWVSFFFSPHDFECPVAINFLSFAFHILS